MMKSILELWQQEEFTGMKPGLQRIKKFLRSAGSPEKGLSVVHIAGTNGKGSVAKIIAGAVTASGLKTALYTSPHLVSITERIQFDGNNISEKELYRLASKYYKKARTFKLTFFEFITGLAFLYFKKKKPDIAVLETGLGGRFDATNVFQKTVVSVITDIDYDHSRVLGNTLGEIAREKAGIIKQGCPVVTGVARPQARSIIRHEARLKNAPLIEFGTDFSYKQGQINWIDKLQSFFYNSRVRPGEFKISLLGEHQSKNASLALAALETISGRGFDINFQQVKNDLKEVKWPGRFDIRKIVLSGRRKTLIIDGAHNPSAVKAFIKTLKISPFIKGKPALLFAVMKDKDYAAIIKDLSEVFKKVVLLSLNTKRELFQGTSKSIWSKYIGKQNVTVSSSMKDALLALDERVVVVTGSLYLAGKALKYLVQSEKKDA